MMSKHLAALIRGKSKDKKSKYKISEEVVPNWKTVEVTYFKKTLGKGEKIISYQV